MTMVALLLDRAASCIRCVEVSKLCVIFDMAVGVLADVCVWFAQVVNPD